MADHQQQTINEMLIQNQERLIHSVELLLNRQFNASKQSLDQAILNLRLLKELHRECPPCPLMHPARLPSAPKA